MIFDSFHVIQHNATFIWPAYAVVTVSFSVLLYRSRCAFKRACKIAKQGKHES